MTIATMTPPTLTAPRNIERIAEGSPTSDGAGVRLLRVLSHELQRRLDPFLMLDYFESDNPDDYLAGFPSHPHRGFETVTYMLAGRMRHRDNAGHEGLLGAGGVQWMTAGRGIIHSELPEQEDGLMHGFQLWLNLPAADKMTEPGYRDIPAGEIPRFVTTDGAEVKVIAGQSHGVVGAVQKPVTEPLYLDVVLPAGARLVQPLAESANAFVYVYDGSVEIGGYRVKPRRLAVLENRAGRDGVEIASEEGGRFLLIAGQPLLEPIAQWGPFVMNTRAEVEQAVEDFRSGRF
ncbi:pirin family protein [Chitinimonas lacunae]|uniref:Pirin family protein n=1 Tax=Chitinimonas lacunae TaxID=1963018 RepID=A0ABV8MN51_9NEIS